MPEYLAPGVFVEETSFRAKSIEGVGTSTAAFVGLTSRGPRAGQPGDPVPTLLTSFVEFERIYGGIDDLRISDKPVINYLAHAARAFFNNGGGRLYVARVLAAGATPATVTVNPAANANKKVTFTARTAGGARLAGSEANFRVVVSESELTTTKRLALKQQPGTMIKTPAATPEYYVLGTAAADGPKFTALADDGACAIVTLNVEVYDPTGLVYEASGLGFAAAHSRFVGSVMGESPPQLRDRLTNPVMISLG